jgi:hypothetical protein
MTPAATRAFLLILLAILGLWSFCAAMWFPEARVSTVASDAFHAHPILAFMAGLVISHLLTW